MDRSPVIIGVGESSRKTVAGDYPSPVELATAAVKAALKDTGRAKAIAAAVDTLAAIRTFEDSGVSLGTGSPDNMPDAIASASGLSPAKLIYADIGGQSTQAMVNKLAAAIHAGEIDVAIVAAGEAIGSGKRARKAGVTLDWSQPSTREFDNRLSDFPILDRREIRHGIISMPLAYSLIENARRARLGLEEEDYALEMARLWSAFSKKSLTRKHAQFPKAWDVDALMNDADGNYWLTDIYRRWDVAQDAVDLGGAVILTSASRARELGVADDRMVWLTGAAEASEPPLCQRVNLSGSDALDYAIHAALDQAGLAPTDIGPLDNYSCFPCAVFAAVDGLGDPARKPGDYTLTGGLSFFGGPGNGYSIYGIAAVVDALRKDGSKPAMVTANGGVMSKQAVGIYSATKPAKPWGGVVAKGYAPETVELDDAPEGSGTILTYTRPIREGLAGPATVIVAMDDGARALAVLDNPPESDLAGLRVDVGAGEKRHIATLA